MRYKILGNYFENQFHLPATSGSLATENIIKKVSPANFEDKLWECPVDYRHTDQIVDSAINGFQKWRQVSVADRCNYLKKYQEKVKEKRAIIAEAIALETGKPLWEAFTEVDSVIAKVNVTIDDSLPRILTKKIENISPATNGQIYYKPIGACFIIGPFNFPCHLANGQILSCLIAGNSIIFKPSEKTCYSAQLLIEAFHEAGFPKGVINLIQGDGETARRIVKAKGIKGIYFTGSKEVGLKILKETNQDLTKLVCLELGGKNTSIVHSDCQLDFAVAELLKACFLTSGQRCTSTALIAIHDNLKDQFVEKFHSYAKKLIVDHPIEHEREPFMGPLVDQNSVDTYLLYMGMAKREGIEEIMRGKTLEKKYKGLYVSPSIHLAAKMTNDSRFLMDEIFGPNATIIPYKEIEEAIHIANATEYGLASAIFTKNSKIYEQCVQNIDAGIVNLNRSTIGASAKLPFGGIKNSGNYRPAALTTIDACVYQVASLEIYDQTTEDISEIKGIGI
jgi:succinylglutamic semialdehyde dehydrogenase